MDEKMALFTKVPVVEINKQNLSELWPSLLLALESSYFVAIDLELSGLGSKKALNAQSVEERYKALSEVANSHAIISLGISCFKMRQNEKAEAEQQSTAEKCDTKSEDKAWRFLVQTFNILVLCSEPYMVEPNSLQFLVEHNFDFNRQYALGVPYYRGNDKANEKPSQSLRQLFVEILRNKKPVVLHNGLVDLIFLYHSFYCALPKVFQSFVADLNDMFAGGIYDTKYIAEFRARMPASYLEYVFRKRQRENMDKMMNEKIYVDLTFLDYANCCKHVDYRDCSIKIAEAGMSKEICQSYANFGWCQLRQECPLSHDIDDIIDANCFTKTKKNQKHKKGAKTNHVENMDTNETELSENKATLSSSGCHRAGYDAFMTGFSLATFLASYSKCTPVNDTLEASETGFENLRNQIYLVGKTVPLFVKASTFSKCSKLHCEKKLRFNLDEDMG